MKSLIPFIIIGGIVTRVMYLGYPVLFFFLKKKNQGF